MENTFVPRAGHNADPHPNQVAFEDQRVRILLKRFGLTSCIPEMISRFEENWGGPTWLTFESFHEFFPTFPIVLEAHWFHHLRDLCTPVKLFRSFSDSLILQRYLDVYARGQDEAEGRPIGMVIPFDGFYGGMVIHNGCFDTLITKIFAPIPDDESPHRVVIEPFIPLINHLVRGGWTPDSRLPRNPKTQRPRIRQSSSIMPWMVRLLGAGPDTILLGYLYRVLRSKSGYDRALILQRGGQRWVALTQDELAERTGLSISQTKSAVASLRRHGLLCKYDKGLYGLVEKELRHARLTCR